MGNKIDTQKPKQLITEISETTEINDAFLKSEFDALFNLVGADSIESNSDFENLLKEEILKMCGEGTGNNNTYVENFTNNLLKFIDLIDDKEHELRVYRLSLQTILILLDCIFSKFKTFRELLINSIDNYSNGLPLNILFSAIKLLNDTPDDELGTGFSHLIIKIISSVLVKYSNNANPSNSFMEYFDAYKFVLALELEKKEYSTTDAMLINTNIIEKFISKIISGFLYFNYLPNIKGESKKFEDLITHNFYTLIIFSYDVNSFFFKDAKITDSNPVFFFENEYNEKIYKFVENSITDSDNKSVMDFISEYNRKFSRIIIDNILYNNLATFKEFIKNFFTLYERLNPQFRTNVKIFLIFLFEKSQDLCEMICLNKEHLQFIMNKLVFNDFFDLILFNKLTICKNFYIMLKYIQGDTTNSNSHSAQGNMQVLIEKCLEFVLLNRKGNLKLDPVSYVLLINTYNLSFYTTEINSSILLKIGEFLTYFVDIEINQVENLNDNLVVVKLFLEILINFIKNVEFPSNLILSLLKFQDQFEKINKKYSDYYLGEDNTNYPSNNNSNDGIYSKYSLLYNRLILVLNKFKKGITEEGANIKFTQNSELLKIINKISIDKDGLNAGFTTNTKENIIFGTETEKFIILTLNSNTLYEVFK